MRKELTARGDEIKLLKDQAQALVAEREELKKKIAVSDARIAQLELTASRAAATATTTTSSRGGGDRDNAGESSAELRRKVSEQASELQELKEELADARRLAKEQAASGKKTTANANAATTGSGLTSEEQRELLRLRQENDNLRKELAAFDLDFFEEIENLKYAHAEAVKKLRVYEGQGR